MKTPDISTKTLKKTLLDSAKSVLHKFDWGSMHKLDLCETDNWQSRIIDYNITKGIASLEELDMFFDESYGSDLSFIETHLSERITVHPLLINEVNGSTLSLYLMSLEELHWTYYTIDGAEFYDVLFNGGNTEQITSVLIWLYLTDRKPEGYHKVTNFLKPSVDNVTDTRLELSHLLDIELTQKLIEQSPISVSFPL